MKQLHFKSQNPQTSDHLWLIITLHIFVFVIILYYESP